MLKSQKGITLVALVVTIVVLIILATISISVAINGGLIDRSQEAKNYYESQETQFNEFEANSAAFIQQYLINAGAPTNTATGE